MGYRSSSNHGTETAVTNHQPKVKNARTLEESSRRLGADEAEARLLALGSCSWPLTACRDVLPASTKYLVDNVISKRQIQLLTPIVLAVLAATVLQGLTSFTLTQVLSKSAQKMIAELRRRCRRTSAGSGLVLRCNKPRGSVSGS